MPVVKHVTAVVNHESISRRVHHIPCLVTRETAVIAEHHEFAWLTAIFSSHISCEPNLSAIDSNQVEKSFVVDLAVIDIESKFLAVIAIVERIEAANDIPHSINQFIFNGVNDLGWVATSYIVDSIRRGQGQTVIVYI